MCLSTVYKDEMRDENIIMKNCMKVECHGDTMVLTDLMERTKKLHAELKCADLTEAYVIIHEKS